MNSDVFQEQKKKRWIYLAAGLILLLFLGLIYAWSVFRIPLEQEFGWSRGETSATFSVSMIMFCLGGLASGVLTGKKGPQFTLFCCAAFLAVGFATASQITSLMGIYITYGGLCGFGVGLGYNATISTIVKWFPDKQGLISGLALMGFGFGGMILGTVGAGLILSLGWRMTFLIFSGAFAVIFIAGALLLRPVQSAFLQALSITGKGKAAVEELTYKQMLGRKNFWLYFLYSCVLSAAGLAVINISANYAGDVLGGDLTQAAAIAGVISVTNGLGRVMSGQLFDVKGYRLTMFCICLILAMAAGTLMLAETSRNMMILVLAFVLLGLGYGGIPPVNSAFTMYFFGGRNYALNYSITNLCLLPASVLGPLCTNGSYMMTFMAVLVFAVAGSMAALGIRQPKEERQPEGEIC